MITHYHGTPIWGGAGQVLDVAVRDGGAFVSYARPDQLNRCLEVAASVALDNGAFSAWKSGLKIDWNDFYRWLEPYYYNPKVEFFCIPDVVDGGEDDNDKLIDLVPFEFKSKAAPVWHLHEGLNRLKKLAGESERICLGSSGEFAAIRTKRWHARMHEAMISINEVNANCKIHGLRMLDGRVLGNYPLTTADSTNLACNVPKTEVKYPHLTSNVRTADYAKGLDERELKILILKHRCAVMRNTIEMVRPPSIEQYIKNSAA